MRRGTLADVSQFGLFKIAHHVKRMAIDQGEDRLASCSVITRPGGKVSDPAINRGFNHRLSELPLGLLERGFGDGNAGLHRFDVDVGGIKLFGGDIIL